MQLRTAWAGTCTNRVRHLLCRPDTRFLLPEGEGRERELCTTFCSLSQFVYNNIGAYVLWSCLAALVCAPREVEAGASTSGSAAIRYETSLSAGEVPPPTRVRDNPYTSDLESAQTGARLFTTMNCDGCHGGGGLGFVGPSLVDGRWHYGNSDQEIFHSIFYGRPQGMPAYGGMLGDDGVWLLVTYLKSQPVPRGVGATTLYEDPTPPVTPEIAQLTPPVTAPPEVKKSGVKGMLEQYGCLACHAVEKKSVGPAFHAVAEKYRAQTGAAMYLATRVRNGGAGVWGEVPMPPHADVPNTDLTAIITWILSEQ